MTPDDASRDRRLHEVLGEYYEAVGAGPEPDRAAWIARHPDLAGELAEFFDGQDRLRDLAEPISGRVVAATTPRDFGAYHLVREIARGGMGVVFEARQKCPDRPVALKMILAGAWASDADLRRFQVEAEAAAGLDHPHIVPVHEVGRQDGLPFYTMKLMTGGTLAGRMSGPTGDPRWAAEAVATVALAVHHAHRRGVLHRDLKPSNILLDAEGRPHVADFGLARWPGAVDELTRTGTPLGSPPYMAPEQASGRRDAVSTATDVHGLGAVLYALLTGAAPFRGGSVPEILERVRNDPPSPPSKANPKVDRDLETICLKCLEKDPARRYQSAEAMAEDLRRWRDREPIAARPVGPAGRAWRWCRREPLPALAAAMAAMLAVVTLAGLVSTVRAQAEALAQRRRADDHYRRVLHGVSRLMRRMHDRATPDTPGLRAMRAEVSSQAIDLLRGVIDLRGEDFEARMDSGEALLHVAEIEFLRGEAGAGFRDLEAAVAAFEGLAAGHPGRSRVLNQLGQAHHILALRMAAEGRPAAESAGHCASAADAYRRALESGQDVHNSLNYSSWFLSVCPDPSLRDPGRAVDLARRGLGLDTGFGSLGMWNNLGVALYRAGRYAESVDALETSARLRKERNAFDGFFLAMAHARLGHPDEARKRFDESTSWMDRNNPTDHELILFRAEALETLARPAPPCPAAGSPENRDSRAR